jgi:predicted membrane channel-forming protein YqfA (hemolysin III family)
MKLQKNLLLIPAIIAFGWGLFGLFAPQVLMNLLKIPEESVNPFYISTQMSLAIAQISLGIIAIWLRSLKDKNLMGQAMSIVALIFLLFGLEAVLDHLVIKGLAMNMFLFIQGIVFIILAVVFFVWKNPK